MLALYALALAVSLAAGPPAATTQATPAPSAAPEMPRAMEEGRSPAWLGVLLEDATDGGVEILALVPGGPAQQAGLRAGDLILELNRVPVADLAALGRVVEPLRPGSAVAVTVLRGDKTQTVSFQAGKRGIGFAAPSKVPAPGMLAGGSLGLTLAPIPEDLRRHYGAPASEGALITRIVPESAAAKAGARVGDVLVGAAGHPISTAQDLLRALLRSGSGERLELDLVRAGRTLRVSAAPGQGWSGDEAGRPFGLWRAQPGSDSAARVLALEAEIERLQARIAELERRLEASRKPR